MSIPRVEQAWETHIWGLRERQTKSDSAHRFGAEGTASEVFSQRCLVIEVIEIANTLDVEQPEIWMFPG